MFFKYAILYKVHQAAVAVEELEAALAEFAFRPVSPREARRVGWTTPAGRSSEIRAHAINGHYLLAMLRQERLLPAAVINDEVDDRCAAREQAEGQPVSRREKQLIKEAVLEELLPQAFTRTQRIELWWDTQRGTIAVNASSRKRAEEVLDLLRQTLGSLKVTPLATKTPPARVMTQWLVDPGTRPQWLTLGGIVELRAAEDDGVFRARQVDLDSEEVQTLVENGRQATQMSIGNDSRARFVLTDDLAIKSLTFDDALLDQASSVETESEAARVDADFAIMTDVFRDVIAQLIDALGGEAVATEPTALEEGVSIKTRQPVNEAEDALLADAATFVFSEKRASISALQRRFKIGYNRAARLIEDLERAGVVSAMDNSGKRRVVTARSSAP
ncbi:recombination-associated protein RdgC [Salinicola sp. CPA57]|uniref:recombination-associated protein RdgC n=1 Tax=Salinicola sp. CPA57 TaxID=1949080 RepID=UPI0032B01C11